MKAPMPLAIAWPKVSLTCMNTAVRGTVLVAWNRSPISARPFAHDVGRGLEVAEHELVALLGDLRRGGDVDDVAARRAARRPARSPRSAPESNAPTSTLRALLDQALGAGARGVDVGLVVGVHDLDVDAEHLLDHAGREVGALLARLADEALDARARQDHADAQLLRLRAHDAEWVKRCAAPATAMFRLNVLRFMTPPYERQRYRRLPIRGQRKPVDAPAYDRTNSC